MKSPQFKTILRLTGVLLSLFAGLFLLFPFYLVRMAKGDPVSSTVGHWPSFGVLLLVLSTVFILGASYFERLIHTHMRPITKAVILAAIVSICTFIIVDAESRSLPQYFASYLPYEPIRGLHICFEKTVVWWTPAATACCVAYVLVFAPAFFILSNKEERKRRKDTRKTS